MTAPPLPFAGDDVIKLDFDLELYPANVIFRVAYDFTDQFFLYLTRPVESAIRVLLVPRNPATSARDSAGAFANALVDQRLRERVERETGSIRALLVAQAFAEADLIGRGATEAGYNDDPRGIARWQ
jgi:His-Xaa-Ser system protein HxsD